MRIDTSPFKKKALKYLGRTYNSHTKALTTQIFKNLTEENINVIPINSGYGYECINNSDKNVESQYGKWNGGLALPGFSASVGMNTSPSKLSSDDAKSYIIRKNIVNRCELMGELQNIKPKPTEAMHSYLQSCQLEVGYVVIINVKRTKLEEKQKKPAYNLGLVIKCFNIEYHGGGLEKLADNEYFKITLDIKGIGGFQPPVKFIDANSFSESILSEIDDAFVAQLSTLPMKPVFDIDDDLMPFPANEITIPQSNSSVDLPPIFPILHQKSIRTLELVDEKKLAAMAGEIKGHLSRDFKALDITKILVQLQSAIKQVPSTAKPIILVVGTTMAGKSTLICSLMGIPLEMKINKLLREVYYEVSPNYRNTHSYPHIAHHSKLGTTVPAIYEIDEHNITDCPGFLDMRGTEADLINQMTLQVLINLSGGIRGIIVVIDKSFFINRDVAGLSKLPTFLKSIVHDPKKIIESKCLKFVITKTSGCDEAKGFIKKNIAEWLKDYASPKLISDLKSAAIKVAKFLPFFESYAQNYEIKKPIDKNWGEANELLSYFESNFDKNVFLSNPGEDKQTLLPHFSKKGQLIANNEINLRGDVDKIKNFILAIINHANEKSSELAKLYSEVGDLEHEVLWISDFCKNNRQSSLVNSIESSLRQKEMAVANLKLTSSAVENGFEVSIIGDLKNDKSFDDQLGIWKKIYPSNALAGKVLFIRKPLDRLWYVHFINNKNEIIKKVIPRSDLEDVLNKNKVNVPLNTSFKV